MTEQDSTTFEAIEGMAVFDCETQSFWVAPRPKDKSGVVYDELSETDKKKFGRIQIQGNRQLVEIERPQCDVFQRESDPLCQDNPENIHTNKHAGQVEAPG